MVSFHSTTTSGGFVECDPTGLDTHATGKMTNVTAIKNLIIRAPFFSGLNLAKSARADYYYFCSKSWRRKDGSKIQDAQRLWAVLSIGTGNRIALSSLGPARRKSTAGRLHDVYANSPGNTADFPVTFVHAIDRTRACRTGCSQEDARTGPAHL